MRHHVLRSALLVIKEANDWHVSADNLIEGCAHELAHALVIGRGRICRHFDTLLAKMKTGHRNRNELIAMTVQLAGLKRLGFHQSLKRSAAPAAFYSLDGREEQEPFPTIASVERFLKSYRPSPFIVNQFVWYVRTAAKVVGR